MIIDKLLYTGKKLGQTVRCPNPEHHDKKPSAIYNESNIYCFVCSKAFFFENLEKKNLYSINLAQAKTYYDNLKNAEASSQIRQYLTKRNIASNYIIDEFQLGFDCTKNALAFPIKNSYGDINGFGFRSIIDTQEPKYWNSAGRDKSDSIFEKSNNLYGIDKVTDKCKHLIICEGYICVISAFKKEFKNDVCFVATMGTALSENHLKLSASTYGANQTLPTFSSVRSLF